MPASVNLRPLDRIASIKTKLGIVIVATVIGTVATLALGRWTGIGLPFEQRVIAAILIGLAVAQFLARGMTSPLRDMASAATAMAGGDYSRRVRATSRDEVGDLARAFNAMAGELAEVDRMRRDLVANVSHELRTPIGALRVVLENLVDGIQHGDGSSGGSGTRDERLRPAGDPTALETALAQTERLGRLVEQLLDLSRLESGGLPMHRTAFELGPVLDQATRECVLGDDDTVQVEWRAEPADLHVTGDAERLHQVVANLLDNAVRHSPPGGRVLVSARPSTTPGAAHRVQIEVTDEGPGIPAAEADRVFERFYRTDRARTTQDGGSGLGLAIARWIVDAHHGTIRAASADPRGCRMVVELPR